MRKIAILFVAFVCVLLKVDAQKQLDSLNILDKIKPSRIESVNLHTTYSNDDSISLRTIIAAPVNGICISGMSILNSDSSMVRIVMVDLKGNEYLVYESNAVFDKKGKNSFKNRMDETFMVDEIGCDYLRLEIVDAMLQLDKIQFYNVDRSEKVKLDESKKQIRKDMADIKLAQVQNYIKKNGMIWKAGYTQISNKPYAFKKSFFGAHYNSYGFEYYQSGIFESLPHKTQRESGQLNAVAQDNFVDEFDWRNRHGQNWMTPVKCQEGCFFVNEPINCSYQDGSWNDEDLRCIADGGDYRAPGTCWAFAAVSGIEAMVNIYYNQHFDLDLSEQQMVTNCYTLPRLRGYQSSAMDLICSAGIVEETCWPYKALKGLAADECILPEERITPYGKMLISQGKNITAIKSALLQMGPLPCTQDDHTSHSVVIVGWSTINIGDYIDYIGIVSDTSMYVGQNYWILKNSYPGNGWPHHPGYIYQFDTPIDVYAYVNPILSIKYSDNDIVCEDIDNDGYYWWGIGEKPSTCPVCTPDEPDGDDSNPNLGPMDIYGNLAEINQPYQFPTFEVNAIESWSTNVSLCGNIVVTPTGNLTLNGSVVSLDNNNSFVVALGGELLITSGAIE